MTDSRRRDNGRMCQRHGCRCHSCQPRSRQRPRAAGGTPVLFGVLVPAVLLTGCTGGSAPADEASPFEVAAATPADDPRAELAALAAAAADRHLLSSYTFTVPGRPVRTVTAHTAPDGSWRVDVPEGALGGAAGVTVAQTPDGLFQCALPTALRPDPATCVRVAEPGGQLPAFADPRVQHVFTRWRAVLTDQRAPLAVSRAEPPAGASGACFAVENTSASLSAPLDVGVYCYAPDGTLTAAAAGFGTLVLASTTAPAPPTVGLPGPVVPGDPIGLAAPSQNLDSASPPGQEHVG